MWNFLYVYDSILSHMSLLFHKKSQRIIRAVFLVVGILVVISMLGLYAPGIFTYFY
jgi:hypothetical protein